MSGSFLALFPDELPAAGEVGRMLTVAPIVDIVDGRAVFDEHQATKQPDWSHAEIDSGVWPAAGHDVSMAEVAIRSDRP